MIKSINQRTVIIRACLSFCILLVTSSCSNISPSVLSNQTPIEPNIATEQVSSYPGSSTYPYPLPNISYLPYPYPYPIGTATEFIIATKGPPPLPNSETGVVTGRIFADGKPITNATLYLANVVKDSLGVERLASYSRDHSPQAVIDGEGRFYFSNIQPAKYGLVLYMVVENYLLHVPGKDEQLQFIVDAGKVTDLGDIRYEDFPIDIP